MTQRFKEVASVSVISRKDALEPRQLMGRGKNDGVLTNPVCPIAADHCSSGYQGPADGAANIERGNALPNLTCHASSILTTATAVPTTPGL